MYAKSQNLPLLHNLCNLLWYAGIVYLWECFQVELREMGLSDFPYTNIVATIMHNIN